MKNMVRLVFIGIITMLATLSCWENDSVQRAVDQCVAGEISIDSFSLFYTDSINKKAVLAWAERHKSDDYLALATCAYEKKQYNLMKDYMIISASHGNPFSIFSTGIYYFSQVKSGRKQYVDSACFWLTKAAGLGASSVYVMLAELDALVTEQSFTPKAIQYWRKGAQLGDEVCIINLAKAYYYGQGIEKNKSIAFNILNSTDISKLHPDGAYLLAKMYSEGEGVKQNFYKAFKYYQYAANRGHTDSMCHLGIFYHNGTGVERDDSLAFVQFSKAANEGSAWGQRCVAIAYECGHGTKVDYGIAAKWYSIAAKNGDEIAIKYCKGNNIDY